MFKLLTAAMLAACVSAPALAEVTFYTDFAAFSAAVPKTTQPIIRADLDPSEDGHYVDGPVSFGPLAFNIPSVGFFQDAFGQLYVETNGVVAIDTHQQSVGLLIGSYFGTTIDVSADGQFLGTFVIDFATSSSTGVPPTQFLGFTSPDYVRHIEITNKVTGYPSDTAFLNFYTQGGVPEPTTWAMLLAGFGLAGMRLRRRRTKSGYRECEGNLDLPIAR